MPFCGHRRTEGCPLLINNSVITFTCAQWHRAVCGTYRAPCWSLSAASRSALHQTKCVVSHSACTTANTSITEILCKVGESNGLAKCHQLWEHWHPFKSTEFEGWAYPLKFLALVWWRHCRERHTGSLNAGVAGAVTGGCYRTHSHLVQCALWKTV